MSISIRSETKNYVLSWKSCPSFSICFISVLFVYFISFPPFASSQNEGIRGISHPHPNRPHIHTSHHNHTHCHQYWKDIELFLPVSLQKAERISEWKDIFLNTYLTFWPVEAANTKLMLMLDKEDQDNEYLTKIRNELASHPALTNRSRIVFNDVPGIYYANFGWKRQQYVMFYADNFTSAEYVGFVDTDCMFITYVHSSDIFEHGKPVINGKIGDPWQAHAKEDMVWKDIMETNSRLMGFDEPMKCMSYWPVVIKVSHIVEFRHWLEKKYNMPFYDIIRIHVSKKWFGQFDLFCMYLYHFRQDDYVWYVHNISPQGWKTESAFKGMNTNMSIYSKEMYYPKPRVAIHARYHVPQIHAGTAEYFELLYIGICASPPFPKHDPLLEKACSFYQSSSPDSMSVFVDQYRFEKFNFFMYYNWKAIQRALYDRHQHLLACPYNVSNHVPVSTLQRIFARPYIIQEGEIVYSDMTGPALFLVENSTLRGFANWNAFVKRGLQDRPKRKISTTVYNLFPSGELCT